MGTYTADPVSVAFEEAARSLLDRAYHSRDHWVTSRVADPTPAQKRRFASIGIDVDGPDVNSAVGGRGLDAKSRWCRGIVRALYREHKGHSGALRVEIGRRVPALGVIPAGRQIRIQVTTARAAAAAVNRLASVSRIYNDDGSPALRHSDPDNRDWAS